MTAEPRSPDPAPGQLWGRQYPFERNHLQRLLTLMALGAVLSATVIFLAQADLGEVVGVSLVCGGVVCALGALSRLRYVRETQQGFAVVRTRDGRFVLESAAAFVVVAVAVATLVLT